MRAHLDVLRRRREWFERMAEPSIVLWWVEAGHRPSVAEAVERLERLRRDGPCPEAFTFRTFRPPPIRPKDDHRGSPDPASVMTTLPRAFPSSR